VADPSTYVVEAEAQRRTVRKLAEALGVDPAELVEQHPENPAGLCYLR